MTLEQMRKSEKIFLVPEEVAEVLGCKPYSINLQAKADPEKLGFPVCLMGASVRIPRMAFIHWIQYGNAAIHIDESI